MKLLVVEDAPETVDIIQLWVNMRWPDAIVVSTESGFKGTSLVALEAPDIVILDLGLPDMDGLDVLKEIRRDSDVPVVIVTARDEEAAIVKGLEIGADDYIVKPFSHGELVARIRAVLRRTRMPELRGDERIISRPGLAIDLARQRLLVEGREVNLTRTEWKLLSYLVRNEGRVASYRVLAERVWGTDYLSNSAVKMCVRRLRMKLGHDARSLRIIVSHWGIGYSFVWPR